MERGNQDNKGNRSGRIGRFEDLVAWQQARELTQELYSRSSAGSLKHDFGLRDQLRRAAVSVMSNLAEGFERVGLGEKVQFMNVARASCAEVKSLLYVCLDNDYLESHVVTDLQSQCTRISRLTSGLIRSVSRKRPESESESGRERRRGTPIQNTDSKSDSETDSEH